MPSSPSVKIGFIPLMDCAPFVIAQEKGYFLEHGVNVLLSKEASWASVRDKVAFKVLDGAHMLASMPVAASLGVGTVKTAMHTSFVVSHNGNGITVSNRLHERMKLYANDVSDLQSGTALKHLVSKRCSKDSPLRFAIVYPYSSHNYQLRDWLDKAGIDPDKDVQIIVIPPTKMIDYLKLGEIDGYCVGEPWNSLAEEQKVGKMLTTGFDIWGSAPEKVFGVNSQWAELNPQAHCAIIKALDAACKWVSQTNNQPELLHILSHPDYLNCPEELLTSTFKAGQDSLSGQINQCFSGQDVNLPKPSYALWIMAKMYRWQQLAYVPALNDVAEQVYRQDLYCKIFEQTPEISTNWKLSDEQQQTWLDDVASSKVLRISQILSNQ